MSKLHKVARTVQRRQSERSSDKTIDNMIDYWKVQLSKSMGLHANIHSHPLKRYEDSWLVTFDLEITREDKSSRLINEDALENTLQYLCKTTRWNKYPFVVCKSTNENIEWWNPDNIEDVVSDEDKPNYDGLIPFDVALRWEEFDPSDWAYLIDADDDTIEAHEAFQGIYHMGAHIRLALGTIKRAIDTGGAVRNHTVFFGSAGCGKTSTLEAIMKLFPENAYLKIHAESATNAGVRKTFFKELSDVGVPPIFVLEECDKCADPHMLTPFLSIFDRRGKIQQMNARMSASMNASVLGFVTVNDKERFDGFLSGALSSRCSNQLYFPRPSDNILRRILKREITEFGGEAAWIEPCIELSRELQEDDPRVITGHLAGGTRLLTGAYQNDILATRMMTTRLREIQQEESRGVYDKDKDAEYQAAMRQFKQNGFKGD